MAYYPTTSWKRMLLAALCWYVMLACLHMPSVYYGWGWLVNQFIWKVVGPPENEWSFRNLVLHRLILAAMISVPPALLGVVVMERWGLTWRRLLLGWLYWSGSFGSFYYLSIAMIRAILETGFGPQGMFEDLGNSYLAVLVVVSIRGLPAAFLGVFLYQYVTRHGAPAIEPQGETTNTIGE